MTEFTLFAGPSPPLLNNVKKKALFFMNGFPKVEFEFEYLNLHLCINECEGAHEGKFREKCKFSHLYFL